MEPAISRQKRHRNAATGILSVPKDIPSATQMAGILGMDDKTLRGMVSSGMVDINEDGSYPFQKTIQSYIKRLKEEAKGFPAETAKLKHEQARIDLETSRIERDKKSGALIPLESYMPLWVDAIVKMRQKIEGSEELTEKQKKHVLGLMKSVKLANLRKQ